MKNNRKSLQTHFFGKQKTVRTVSVLLCLLLLLAALFSLASCAVTSQTYSFENGNTKKINGWKKYNYRAEYESENRTSFTIEQDGYSGHALKIESSDVNDARVYRKIRVSPGSVYEIRVMIKTVNVTGGAGANISGYNCSGVSVGEFGTTDGWVTRTVYLTTGEKQKSVQLSLGLGGYGAESSGTVYFDELTVKKVDAVPEGAETLSLTDRSSQQESNDVSVWFKLIFTVVMTGGILYCFGICLRDDRNRAAVQSLSLSRTVGRLDKKDAVIMIVMTVVCAAFSFSNLGSFEGTPNRYWKAYAGGEYVDVALKEESAVTRVAFFTGISSGKGSYEIQYMDEGGNYVTAATIRDSDVDFYKWQTKNVNFTSKYIRVYAAEGGLWLNEVGFYTGDEETGFVQADVDPNAIATGYIETGDAEEDAVRAADAEEARKLFDEQDDVRSRKTYMDSTYFDEIYFPRTAYEQIHGLSIYERTHPPLGKVFMQLGILAFGMNTFGWRFSGTLFGVAMVPLLYAFGRKVFKKRLWAFMTAFLMMFDFMRLAQTRLATIDSYSCFFAIAMYYCMYDYFVVKSYDLELKRSLKPLLFCGLMFGLGASSKWTCVYTGAGLAILFFIAKIAEYVNCRDGYAGKGLTVKKWVWGNLLPTCGACLLFFVVIPGVIYVCSYIPYMASNPDKSLLEIVLDNQVYMYSYHSGLTAPHAYGSKWYTWPWMTKPIWYYLDTGIKGYRSTIVSMGNPLVWWIGLPCVLLGGYFAWRNRDKRMSMFIIAYILQYAPWILINRVCFIYHYFTAMPFTIFLIVYVFKELTEKKIIPKWSVYVYMGLVLLLFILFYPVLTGLPVKDAYVQSLRWFSSWSF